MRLFEEQKRTQCESKDLELSRVEQVIDLNATEIFKFFTAMLVLPFSNKVVHVINFDKPYTVFTNL